MPIVTENYKLKAFIGGDLYSASADKQRFNIIDNQLAFLADRVGEGRIYGWKIQLDNIVNKTFKVTTGMGIIGREVLVSYGNFDFSIGNQKEYIYIRKNSNMGAISSFSNIASIEAVNSDIPSAPSNLISIEELISYSQIAFSWDSNTEKDFDHYIIQKIIDEEYIDNKKIAETKETSFIDENLDPDTEYKYRVIAVDMSGNESEYSEIIISTAKDLRPPLPPSYLEVVSQKNSVQIVWDNSPSYNVEQYLIKIYNSLNNLVGEYYINENEEDGSGQIIIDNLINYHKYTLYIYSVSIENILSDRIIKKATPINYIGAGEIYDLNINMSKSSFENVCLEANIEWGYSEDEYFAANELNNFIINFVNDEKISEPIIINKTNAHKEDDIYDSVIRYIPYKDNNNKIYYETIKEFSSYSVIIKTQDVNDYVSSGRIYRINKTPVCDKVASIDNFIIDRKVNNIVYLNWNNPNEDYFDHLKITCKITDLSQFNEPDEIYVENHSIGKSNSFSIPKEYFKINSRYNIEIIPYDVFGEKGELFSQVETFLDTDVEEPPSPPSNISVQTTAGVMNLSWDISTSEDVEFYKIYRANNSLYLSASDFILLNEISSSYNSYIDYTAESEIDYAYIISSQNIYGNESTNPEDDNVTSNAVVGTLKKEGVIDKPKDLIVSKQDGSDYNVELRWDITAGVYDGYEIYRSIGNNWKFVLIDTIDKFQTFYIDENILLKNEQQYYYMIRKFKNDVDLYSSNSKIPPKDSLYVGSVEIDISDNVTINEVGVKDLANYFFPLKQEVDRRLSNHNHKYQNNFDKRIELKNNVIVGDWQTINYKVYTTDTDIEGASQYLVNIDGEINEDYFVKDGITDIISLRQAQAGLSPINYEIDEDNQKIVFNSILYTTCEEESDPLNPDKTICPSVPYLTEPTITVDLVGISEVKNTLLPNNMEGIYANQVDSGYISKNNIYNINHDGRIRENLYPLRLPTKTSDSVSYELIYNYNDNDRNKIGNSIVFYDICLISNNKMFGATSHGLMHTQDSGNNWEEVFSTEYPIRFIYKTEDGRFFILTNYNVYINGGEVNAWSVMNGLEGVSNIRSITEDINNDVYISTDLGVYRLNVEKPYLENTWEQLSIFGVRSSEAFGLIYNNSDISSFTNNLLVSNDLGLLESFNDGKSWTYTDDLEAIIIYDFIIVNNYIYGLSDKAVYRKEINQENFIKISDLDCDIARKIVYYNNYLFVTTDTGLKRSNGDIYNEAVEFVNIYSNISKDKQGITYSLNVINDLLYIGTEDRLYILNKENDLWLQYENKNSIAPIIYLNDQKQMIGCYYNNNSNNNISFDRKLDLDDVIEISNKYDIYYAENNGWVKQDFNSELIIYINSFIYGYKTNDNIPLVNLFENMIFPEYDTTNAYVTNADIYKQNILDEIEKLNDISLDIDQKKNIISNIYNFIDKFLSQLYIQNRKDFTYPSIKIPIVKRNDIIQNGNVTYEEVQTGTEVDVVSGLIYFGEVFSKYDNLNIDIKGISLDNDGDLSHNEIEDKFELFNSGLPTGLSQIQQSNINKFNIFIEKNYEGDKNLYQSEVIIPSRGDWFDSFNSTINFDEIYKQNIDERFIRYPVTSLYYDDYVYIADYKNIAMINIFNLEIFFLDIELDESEIIKEIKIKNDILYLLTNYNIYKSENKINWERVSRTGLPNDLYNIGFINNNIIISAIDGIYSRGSEYMSWNKVYETDIFIDIISPDLLFAISSNNIYITGDGYNYSTIDISNDILMNKIIKFNSTFYIASNNGLYSGMNTLYSESPSINKVELNDNDFIINCLASSDEKMYIGLNNGGYYEMIDGEYNYKEYTGLKTIHNILIVNNIPWFIGNNLLKIENINYPITLSESIPF